MNAFWSFVVSQFVLLLGIAGSVWVGRSTQTGPRRKVEDLKLAAEALQVVESPEQRRQIVLFMERQTKQLARLSDRRGRLARLSGVILSIAAIGFTVWAVVVSILSNANLLPSSGVSWTHKVTSR